MELTGVAVTRWLGLFIKNTALCIAFVVVQVFGIPVVEIAVA